MPFLGVAEGRVWDPKCVQCCAMLLGCDSGAESPIQSLQRGVAVTIRKGLESSVGYSALSVRGTKTPEERGARRASDWGVSGCECEENRRTCCAKKIGVRNEV